MTSYILPLVLLPLLAVSQKEVPSQVTHMGQYCQTDEFKPECKEGQVILMHNALYGRMQLGRCVEIDLGYLGCHADVLRFTDHRCSGRRTCHINVPDKEFEGLGSCLQELKSYLEASYSCVDVLAIDDNHCEEHNEINITSPNEGFISSTAMTNLPKCQETGLPWVIIAQPGQKINLTLYDFSVEVSYDSGDQEKETVEYIEVCHEYGLVEDAKNDRSESICGGARRVSHVYLSGDHILRIWFTNSVRQTDVKRFLLKYAVLGCADITPNANSQFERTTDGAIIRCLYSEDSWAITCKNNVWEGQVGNCSGPKAEERDDEEEEKEPGGFPFSYGIAIAIILGAAVGVALVIFIVGYIRHRRRRHQEEENPYDAGTLGLRARAEEQEIKNNVSNQQQVRLLEESTTKYPIAHELACSPNCRHQRHPVTVNGNEYEHIWESPLPLPSGNAVIKAGVKCTIQNNTIPRCSAETHLLPALTFSTFKAPDLITERHSQPISSAQVQRNKTDSPQHIISKDIAQSPRRDLSCVDSGRYSSLDRSSRINDNRARPIKL